MSHDSDRLIAEYAYVLFMDIVGYTLLPTLDDKKRMVAALHSIARNTDEFQQAQTRGSLIALDTGDGLALVFFHDATAPLYCAVEIARALQSHPELRLRMGINSGLVSRTTDINGHDKVSGEGIDMAQRVMDCGNAGHILLSQSCADLMRQVSHWAGTLHDLGEYRVKHDRILRLYNLCREEVGNPVPPPITPKKAETTIVLPLALLPDAPANASAAPSAIAPRPNFPLPRRKLPKGRKPDNATAQGNGNPAMTGEAAQTGADKGSGAQNRIKTNPIDGAAMVWIPAGTFRMGSENGRNDEKPVHSVPLSGFWMYTTPVTVAQFRKYDAANGRKYDWTKNKPSWDWLDDHPMVRVTWSEASAYAQWAGVALPTEAQWEYAARGGLEGKNYPWGDDWDGSKCASSVSPNKKLPNKKLQGTKPAGSYPANGYGLYDMAGNVWEWCADYYDKDYYKTVASSQTDPTGPNSGTFRVLRGGSWYNYSETYFRYAYRDYNNPGFRYFYFGFRCCMVAPE